MGDGRRRCGAEDWAALSAGQRFLCYATNKCTSESSISKLNMSSHPCPVEMVVLALLLMKINGIKLWTARIFDCN